MTDDQKRTADRESFFLMASLRLRQGEQRVTVRNLSSSGALVHGIAGARVDDPVSIELRNNGWVDGVIVWARDARAGLSFDERIDLSTLREPIPPRTQSSSTSQADTSAGSHSVQSSTANEEFYMVRWMKGAVAVSEVHFDNLMDAKAHARKRLPIQRIRKGITAAEVSDIEGATYFLID